MSLVPNLADGCHGNEFAVGSPVELVVQFGWIQGAAQVDMRSKSGQSPLPRNNRARREVVFTGRRLSGTLICRRDRGRPGDRPPHGLAVDLIHRTLAAFFNSLGFAVLVFDKRGTAQSSGVPSTPRPSAGHAVARYYRTTGR